MTSGMWHVLSLRNSQQQARRKDAKSLKNGQRGSVGIFIGVPLLPNRVLAILYWQNGNHSFDMLQTNMPATLILSTKSVTTRNFHLESGLKLVSYHTLQHLGSKCNILQQTRLIARFVCFFFQCNKKKMKCNKQVQ